MKPTHGLAAAALVAALAAPALAGAAVIGSSLGNTASGFSDGDILDVPTIAVAQGGQPAPFDSGKGSDNLGFLFGTFDETWSHSGFGPIVDPILGATLTIGIYDHDSAATGSQVASFTLDGIDGTAALDALFEAPGDGEQVVGQGSEFNIYTLDLLALGVPVADLLDGTLNVALALQGPALIEEFDFSGPVPVVTLVETTDTSNGAHLIFSTLTIETEDPSVVAPAPATLALLGLGLLGIVGRRTRRA